MCDNRLISVNQVLTQKIIDADDGDQIRDDVDLAGHVGDGAMTAIKKMKG